MTTHADQTLTMIREVCALGRVEYDRPHTPEGDPDAGRALVKGLQALDQDGEPSDISLSLDLLAPRAPYFDQLVLDAVKAGVRQVVNLGATTTAPCAFGTPESSSSNWTCPTSSPTRRAVSMPSAPTPPTSPSPK
ncbi:class I SAM-dependent methyltransferase [Embleya sp. NPDC005575]|uniref:class I SAM-dependent methyltransferase n=1 Tax=Embleya sp. NPDC005575 TaxID=3156892 RepID=UPI0033B1787F